MGCESVDGNSDQYDNPIRGNVKNRRENWNDIPCNVKNLPNINRANGILQLTKCETDLHNALRKQLWNEVMYLFFYRNISIILQI